MVRDHPRRTSPADTVREYTTNNCNRHSHPGVMDRPQANLAKPKRGIRYARGADSRVKKT